jgi:plasmid replication initiation protein
MNKNYVVTKSNNLINCNYNLSLQEQKIILTLASMVQPQDTEFAEYEFKIKDFIKLLGIKDQSKYTELPKITKELKKKVFEITEGTDLIQVSWLGGVRYKKNEGLLILSLDKGLKPYMLGLKELYTSYKLENVLSLKSKYSIRLFEILKSNLFKKTIEIELEELKKMVGATEKTYNIYNNFKRKVLIQAQKELNYKTDIYFEFEEIKNGRKITSIQFHIKANKTKVENEIAATKNNEVDETLKVNETYIENVKSIIKIVIDKEITDKSANEIYKCATKHNKYGNNPLELINEVAEYSKTQSIKGFVGWFKSTVAEYEKPIETSKKTKFNDYEQRSYDYDELEKKLLGWHEET